MMIHEKIMSGQFLLDLKSDRSILLNAHHHHHHHHDRNHHSQSPSPPMPATKMDIYSAYTYQQQLQQQLIGGNHHHMQQQHYHQSVFNTPIAEVLDLSRRCDSIETPQRKTPSPYQTSSSFGTSSPAQSPTTNSQQQHPIESATQSKIPSNLLFSQKSETAAFGLAASLYPTLHNRNIIKSEPITPPPPPTKCSSIASPTSQLPPVVAATNLLKTFATAAAAASAVNTVDVPSPHSPTVLRETNKPPPATASTPSRAICSQETNKTTTRPFKAFPRDPLVIAANFAATDVLLDNPRVERYTEYRKRVLEQIRNSNGGARTITNPKMRRTNSRNGSIHEGSSSNNNSESDDRNAAEESSDCDSNAGNFEKLMGPNVGAALASAVQNDVDIGSNNNLNISGSQVKDAAYFERRRKNNAAAKKSRDRRRIKEDEIAIRAAYLERQNIELLCQIDALKAQLASFVSKATA